MSDIRLQYNWNPADKILLSALEEDIGNGDITSSALIPENHISKAGLIAKGSFILAGLPFAERVFKLADPGIAFTSLQKEGRRVTKGMIAAEVKGKTRKLLMAERTALNLLQRLSGIATLTGKYVRAVKGLPVKIVDTRKTVPGLRLFEKYAVGVGGGMNHRFGLFDGVLIKDNHIAAVGGVGKAVRLARNRAHHLLKIEVEVTSMREVREALSAGADIIMLDNMPVDKIEKAAAFIRRKKPGILIEVSGNITLENVRKAAESGVDLISVGAITHSAPAADISMMFHTS